MSTLRAAVETGDLQEVLTVISRCQDFLPEYQKSRVDEQFAATWKEVEELEKKLSAMRAKMREEAERIVRKVENNWTEKEIKNCTGYEV